MVVLKTVHFEKALQPWTTHLRPPLKIGENQNEIKMSYPLLVVPDNRLVAHMVVVHVVADPLDNQVHLDLNSDKLDSVLVVVDHSMTYFRTLSGF